jgi:hypothetical protein
MALNQGREGALATRPEHARKQGFVAVAQVFDLIHVEFMRSHVKGCSRHG